MGLFYVIALLSGVITALIAVDDLKAGLEDIKPEVTEDQQV